MNSTSDEYKELQEPANIAKYYECDKGADNYNTGSCTNSSCVFINDTSCSTLENFPQNDLFDVPKNMRKFDSELYFINDVLQESGGLENMGTVQWKLLLSLLLAWVLVFLCLVRGIKSSGKVVYFTATFPFAILIVLFFRAVTLPGKLIVSLYTG